MIPPTLEFEHDLLMGGARHVAGIDEVGRGALAGPVSVGVVVVHATTAEVPQGLADSKLLRAPIRESLVPRIHEWAVTYAVGHASAEEIDAVGIVDALRQAALRALSLLTVAPDVVILDGSHDWLTRSADLFAEPVGPSTPTVRMRVKADLTCASVSAASVLAKVERDAIMRDLDVGYPGYGLAGHKGYGSDAHRDAIRRLGPSPIHRRSWKLT